MSWMHFFGIVYTIMPAMLLLLSAWWTWRDTRSARLAFLLVFGAVFWLLSWGSMVMHNMQRDGVL